MILLPKWEWLFGCCCFFSASKASISNTVIIVVYLFYADCWFISQFIRFSILQLFSYYWNAAILLKKYYHKSTLKMTWLRTTSRSILSECNPLEYNSRCRFHLKFIWGAVCSFAKFLVCHQHKQRTHRAINATGFDALSVHHAPWCIAQITSARLAAVAAQSNPIQYDPMRSDSIQMHTKK